MSNDKESSLLISGIEDCREKGLISGYCLFTFSKTLCAKGSLASEFVDSSPLPSSAQQFLSQDFDKITSFCIFGTKAFVIRRTAKSIQAISRRRDFGIIVYNLPFGTLLVVHSGRKHTPQNVVCNLEATCG